MAKRFYPAVFTEENEGGYSVSFPDLPGCFTEGDTLEQAYEMAFDAIGLYVHSADGETSFPMASNPKQLKAGDNEFVVLVEFDLIEYLKKHDPTLVKKTLTIPAWVNKAGERNGINFSATLTEAVIEKIDLAN